MSVEIVKDLRETFGDDELKQIVIEVKSVASRMFSRYEGENGKPSPQHEMQIFHYLKSKGMDEGHIVYLSKDDMLMAEFGVMNPGQVENAYKADIQTMTGYWNAGEQPPLEPLIKFENWRFKTNWHVEYSNYLTMLYGWERPDQYRDAYSKMTASWTRVFKRCVNGDNMTPANLVVIAEAKAKLGSWDVLVDQAKAAARDNPAILAEDPE
jgi:hypothetical protein